MGASGPTGTTRARRRLAAALLVASVVNSGFYNVELTNGVATLLR